MLTASHRGPKDKRARPARLPCECFRRCSGGAHNTTKTNAELLGIAAETGTVEPGKRADLLVVDGDPLADIALLQRPDKLMAIVKEGQFHKRQI